MTRVAVLADIHGNLPALEAVREELAYQAIDRVIVAGDLINWGPFSAEVVDRVQSEGWAVVRGNNEYYLLDYGTPRAPAGWSDTATFSVLPWLVRQLNGHWQKTIAAWPDTLSLRFPDAPPLRVVHAAPGDLWHGIFGTTPEEQLEGILSGVEESALVTAHTHLTLDRVVGRWHIVNPGSVGVPADGINEASYVVLEGTSTGWLPTFRRVRYDREALFTEFEKQRFVEQCGVVGRLIVEEFQKAQLRLTPFLIWRQKHCPDELLTMDLLDRFHNADIWDYTPPTYRLGSNGQR